MKKLRCILGFHRWGEATVQQIESTSPGSLTIKFESDHTCLDCGQTGHFDGMEM